MVMAAAGEGLTDVTLVVTREGLKDAFPSSWQADGHTAQGRGTRLWKELVQHTILAKRG